MSHAPRTVLVVDDHLDTCRMLVRLLEQSGYRAVCVESGAAALDFVDRQQPDLVILDHMMSGMTGLDVLRTLRGDPRWQGTPVVMYSGTTDEEVGRSAYRLGAQEFLVKGRMAFAELKRVVERHTGRA